MKLKNGKNLSEALSEFRKEKAASAKKLKNYYHKIEEYIELLDNCFGIDGYRVQYSEGKTVQVSADQYVFIVKATVNIYGEDESIVFSFEGYGSHEITRESEGQNKAINLETLGQVGCVNALKSACSQIGSFGIRNVGAGDERSSSDVKQPLPSSVETKSFVVSEGMTVSGLDKNGKPIYVLVCTEIIGEKLAPKPSEIIFYPNQYKDPAKLDCLINWKGGQKRCSFHVTRIAEEKRKNKAAHAAYIFKGV